MNKPSIAISEFAGYLVAGGYQMLRGEGCICHNQYGASADEEWQTNEGGLYTFDFDGYSLNIAFASDGSYAYDCIEIWKCPLEKTAHEMAMPLKMRSQLLELLGKQAVLKFKMEDEIVLLFPSGSTAHFLLQRTKRSTFRLNKMCAPWSGGYEKAQQSLLSLAGHPEPFLFG